MRTRIASRVAGVVAALAALGAASALAVPGSTTPKPQDAAAAKVVAVARDQVGDKYEYGGNGPERWDCSGLTRTLWTNHGGADGMPRRSRDQQAWAWPIGKDAVRPGDLVFFGNPVTHVGIYVGNDRIVDASSSKGAIVERAIWTSDVVRYGRVPRAGIPKPAPPKASTKPKPAPPKAEKPAPVTPPAPPATPGLQPIPPAGHTPRTATTPQMAAFVKALRNGLGHGWSRYGTGPTYDAAGLVRKAWKRAGYGTLPATAAGIERLARPVALRDLAVGDLIFWGRPAVHVGVYVGNGLMIDASRVLRTVSQRRVFASETVRFARLTPRR